MNWETLLCLGDSITIGSRSYLGYPEYCGNYLSKSTQKSWNIINHAVAGYTTIDLARSVDRNFAHLKETKPEIASIMIGTNDLKPSTSFEIFKIAYEQLVVKARLIVGNNHIILIEIPNLMEGVMLPYKLAMNERIAEYNQIIGEIAQSHGLLLCKMNSDASQFYDGVHLNEAGSASFGSQLAQTIIQLRSS
jgi:lysophospholipase L1-like esterase